MSHGLTKPSTTVWEAPNFASIHPPGPILKGSWDLVTRVIIKVTILTITYNPN